MQDLRNHWVLTNLNCVPDLFIEIKIFYWRNHFRNTSAHSNPMFLVI